MYRDNILFNSIILKLKQKLKYTLKTKLCKLYVLSFGLKQKLN